MSKKKFGTLQDAIELARFAHRGQLDKAGLDYIEHPLRVLAAVQGQGARPYVQIAAVLHDVTEDTSFTPEMLEDLGFSEAAIQLVALLDRTMWSRENYYPQIKLNPEATLVKLADIADNSLPWRLAYLKPETQERLRDKYSAARIALL